MTYRSKYISALILLALFAPFAAFAHQPRITENRLTTVPDPNVSKAYYATLAGEPDTYVINATEPFDLYVGILVPDIAGQKTDIVVTMSKDGRVISTLDGTRALWKKMYEPFGADTYLEGPEYRSRADAGTYEIRVQSASNDIKYVLAIGEKEAFDFNETMNALEVIPKLKVQFFNTSPISFIASPFGWGLILIMYSLAFLTGFAYRGLLRHFARNSPRGAPRNIGAIDRAVRLLIAIALLLIAITSTWSPILLFFSGFALFEALSRWCGFYAALGRNTCPAD